ncbi:MAG TPA: ABC transporter ATP-binding protein [Spirochaetia bacterium]|nr:ABC transporter ATP-binding protein [Spirochaetia bacterium]
MSSDTAVEQKSTDIIEIKDVKKYYPVKAGVFLRHVADVKAVDSVTLNIRRGECLGLVGESGCGKTTLGKTLVRLHEATSGRIYFDQPHERVDEIERMLASEDPVQVSEANRLRKEIDITKLSPRRLLALRQRFQIVFQDPSNSLDPRMLVKDIIAEPLVSQRLLGAREIDARVNELLKIVGLSDEHRVRYPHEFSGGQRQRIAVARSLATNPEFIMMDEPTSALDVSVQAQILNLLKALQDEFKLTYLFVTHHLLVVKYISNRIAVMYLGKMVEISPTQDLFNQPIHPYTKALLSAIPVPDPKTKREKIILSGDVPNPINPPTGCRFHPRCAFAKDICREVEPQLETIGDGRLVACHRWREI